MLLLWTHRGPAAWGRSPCDQSGPSPPFCLPPLWPSPAARPTPPPPTRRPRRPRCRLRRHRQPPLHIPRPTHRAVGPPRLPPPCTWARVWQGAHKLHDLDFVSAQTGWALGDGILLGTVDGGQHWRTLGQPRVGPLRQVHFASRTQGWGVAGGADQPVEGSIPATTLVHTSDGGRTWTALAAPAPPQTVCFTAPDD